MKIAILTWFHYNNYGTALQVSALYRFLVNLGHTVDVVRYYPKQIGKTVPDYSLSAVSKRQFEKIRNRIVAPKTRRSKEFVSEERNLLFDRYRESRLSFTPICGTLTDLENLNGVYDAFICGSDQIWSPNNFDPHYFLDFVSDPEKKAAYAPSIGLPRISDRYVEKKMKNLISGFPSLSVRESQGASFIRKLTGKTAVTVLDPTLLLTKNDLSALTGLSDAPAHDEGPAYLLAYMLGSNENQWKQIYGIAKEKGLTVKVVPVFERDREREGVITDPVGPSEFVSLLSSAAYVCTDSFHGTALSVQYHRQFTVFERFSKKDPLNQNSRIYNLLELTSLKDRLVKYDGRYRAIADTDYAGVDAALEAERKKSSGYLLSTLRRAEQTAESAVPDRILADHSLCCGCGACKSVCPVSAITVSRNEEGFFRAKADEGQCIGCGKCVRVCPFNRSPLTASLCESSTLYSYKDGEERVLGTSSSGGFAYRLSSVLMDQGYAIAGCTYDADTKTAKHILITEKEDLPLLQGSKYLQSSFSDLFDRIADCRSGIAVFGTPCQISAVRKRFAKRNDIVYIDLICHGTPSYHLLDRYYSYLNKTGLLTDPHPHPDFRYKPGGWREKTVQISGEKEVYREETVKDYYMRFFGAGFCYQKSCYDCRWRDRTEADLRIGDFWGPRFEKDETGVSMVLCGTPTGAELLRQVAASGKGVLTQQPISDYLTYQQTVNFAPPLFRDELVSRLGNEKETLPLLDDKYLVPFIGSAASKSKAYRMTYSVRMMIGTLFRKK